MGARYDRWELLPTLDADAALQMATDQVLLTRAVAKPRTLTLRFYRMRPAGVTIGRNQRWRRVIDAAECARRGWTWARRPTGGGALLHANEINYTVVMGAQAIAEKSLNGFRGTFAWIMGALECGVRTCGVQAQVKVGESHTSPLTDSAGGAHGLCGRSLTGYEMGTADGKLIAAAQRLQGGALLQHGTIYLSAPDDGDRFWPLNLACEAQPKRYPEGIDTLNPTHQNWTDLGALGRSVSWTALVDRICKGFSTKTGNELNPCLWPETVLRDAQAVRIGWEMDGWHERR